MTLPKEGSVLINVDNLEIEEFNRIFEWYLNHTLNYKSLYSFLQLDIPNNII